MTPIHVLTMFPVTAYVINAAATPMPKITMKTIAAKELLFLIVVTSI